MLLFLGLGLAVGYGVLGRQTSDEELVGMIGLAAAIVGFLGLGYLAYYFIARPRAHDSVTADADAGRAG